MLPTDAHGPFNEGRNRLVHLIRQVEMSEVWTIPTTPLPVVERPLEIPIRFPTSPSSGGAVTLFECIVQGVIGDADALLDKRVGDSIEKSLVRHPCT